jgi:transporter family-2 protein
MTAWFYIAITVGVGVTSALQIAMLGAIARDRGAFEATWVSMLASLGGMAGVMLVMALAGSRPSLARPFDHPVIYGFTAGIMIVALVLASQGLPWYLALTGFLPVPYLLAASFIGPRIGLGVFLAGMIAGQLIGALGLDHVGAFGARTRSIDTVRVAGAVVLLLGVLLIRGRR